MQETSGSTRADLVGGTLDLCPLNIQVPNVVTINAALSLKAKVIIDSTQENSVVIESLDYNETYNFEQSEFTKENLYFSHHFGKMTFVAQILDHLSLTTQVKVTLSSGAPTGSGLGGSSTMAVTLYKAIKKFKGESFDRLQAKDEVQQIEAGILRAGVAGYQDYYPALFGGVLALHPAIGRERIEQLADEALVDYLENNISLIYSGVTRDSGINNWEVYKQFYDGNKSIQEGLGNIANQSQQAYLALKNKEYGPFVNHMIKEGEYRSQLFPAILGEKIENFKRSMIEANLITGVKVCGAGGGGCFLALHPGVDSDRLIPHLKEQGMQVLDFKIAEVIS